MWGIVAGRPKWQLWVFSRDGGCVARLVNSALWASRWPMLQGLPDPGLCRNAAGDVRSAYDVANCTIEHVKDELGMSVRATDDPLHAWTVCWGHHVVGRQWCTSVQVREAARLYIPRATALAIARLGQPPT